MSDSELEVQTHFDKLLEEASKPDLYVTNPWETTPRDIAIQNFHKRILSYNNISNISNLSSTSNSTNDFETFCKDPLNLLRGKENLLGSMNPDSSVKKTSLVSRLREADQILKERREESLAIEMIRQSQYIDSANSLMTDLNNLLVYLLTNLDSIRNIKDFDKVINKIRNNKNKICLDFSYENKIKYIKDLNSILKLLKLQASISVSFNEKLMKNLMDEFKPYIDDEEEGKSLNLNEIEEPSVEFLYDVTALFINFIQSLDAYKVKEI